MSKAVFTRGRCGARVSGREPSCPHCGQSFASVMTCHVCHSAGIEPVDPEIRSRPPKSSQAFRQALSKGFVCADCGYEWRL
jgi:hypothetical protein